MGRRNFASRTKVVLAIAGTGLVVLPAAALGVAGDFTQPATSPEAAGSGAISVAAANFNGDANTDLAVANPGDDNVTIMLGNGTGNFSEPATSPEGVGAFAISVAAANLNGDANIDLAVANFNDDTVTIMLGDGTGNFTATGTDEAAGSDPIAVAAANLDGDADVDLAVADGGADTVTILLNDGSGDFAAAASSPETAGDDPRLVALANLDGDSDIDLATANRDSDNVTVLLNNGSADFAAAAGSPESAGDGPNGIVAANLDGDADVDLATANRFSGDVSVMLNNGSGDFAAAASSPEMAGDNSRTIVAADLGGDGSIDLATGNAGAGIVDNVSILLNNGSGDFAAAPSSPETVGDEPFSIAAANLGGNASTDLAVANSDSDNVTILLNDPAPPVTPTPPTPPVVPPATPSNQFTFGKVKLNKRKGTAKLPVIVPGAGTLKLAGAGLKPQRALPGGPGRVRKPVAGAGVVKLAIMPKGGKKATLSKAGKVTVKAKVTYTPTGGSPNTQTKRVKLKKS